MKRFVLAFAVLLLAVPASADFAGSGFSHPPGIGFTCSDNGAIPVFDNATRKWGCGSAGAVSGDDLGDATYDNVVALWTTCTGYLKSDGTCDTPTGGGTVTEVTPDNVSEISVATGTSTPKITLVAVPWAKLLDVPAKVFFFGGDNVAATDNVLAWKTPRAITVTRGDCYVSADNATVVLMECATDDVTSCTTIDSWVVTNAVTGFSDSSMSDGAVAAGAWLRWTVTAVGSALNTLSCTVQFTE